MYTRIANMFKLAKRVRHFEPSGSFHSEIIYGSAVMSSLWNRKFTRMHLANTK
jgi:hypothetical protein